MPNTILLLIIIICIYLFLLLFNKSSGIKRIINKKSKHNILISTTLNKSNFEKVILTLTKDKGFKYNVEFIGNEKNQYILSDNISFYSWGFYYLLEYNNNKINIFLKPKYVFEMDRFGLFSRRIEKLSAIIHLIENEFSVN